MFLLNYYKLLISAVLSALSLFGIITMQKDYSSSRTSSEEKVSYQRQEQQLKASAKLLKQMPSFGFDNLVADWAYLKYIQYFGDSEARDEVGYSVITDYFETIVEKDPKFIKASLSLSAGNSIFAGNPERTVFLLDKSAKSLKPTMPNYPFMIFAYKAVDEILFLGDLKAAKESYKKAAEWAEIRNDKIGNHVVKLYRDTIKFLDTNPDSSMTQIAGWSMILERNNDPRIQNYAIQKIRDVGGQVIIDNEGEITVKPPKKNTNT